MQIDEAGSDKESTGINHIQCPIGGDVRLDRCDLPIHDRHVGSTSKPAARVAYLTVLDQDVITLKLLRVGQRSNHTGGCGAHRFKESATIHTISLRIWTLRISE